MRVLFFIPMDHVSVEPIGIMSLSAALRQAGHETRLVLRPHDEKHVSAILRDYQPDILAFSLVTGAHNSFLPIIKQLKGGTGAVTIVGGSHATFFPEVLLEDGIDCICRGEGDEAMVDLANALEAGEAYDSIQNLWVKLPNGSIKKNPLRQLVRNLDELPIPDRGILHEAGWPQIHGIAMMMAGRGCPYNCTYCFNHAYRKLYDFDATTVRKKSVSRVIYEAIRVKAETDAQQVFFFDDCFGLNKTWLREFAERWPAEVGLPFACYARFNHLSEEFVHLLKKAGCTAVIASLEAGNDRIRNDLLRRNMSMEQIEQGAKRLREAGLALHTAVILGLPFSSLEDDLESVDVLSRLKVTISSASLYQPYPGTDLANIAKEAGLCFTDIREFPATCLEKAGLRIPDARARERLQAILPLAVEFSLVRKLVPVLLKLPIDSGGRFMSRVFTGYRTHTRIYSHVTYTPTVFLKQVAGYLLKKGA